MASEDKIRETIFKIDEKVKEIYMSFIWDHRKGDEFFEDNSDWYLYPSSEIQNSILLYVLNKHFSHFVRYYNLIKYPRLYTRTIISEILELEHNNNSSFGLDYATNGLSGLGAAYQNPGL